MFSTYIIIKIVYFLRNKLKYHFKKKHSEIFQIPFIILIIIVLLCLIRFSYSLLSTELKINGSVNGVNSQITYSDRTFSNLRINTNSNLNNYNTWNYNHTERQNKHARYGFGILFDVNDEITEHIVMDFYLKDANYIKIEPYGWNDTNAKLYINGNHVTLVSNAVERWSIGNNQYGLYVTYDHEVDCTGFTEGDTTFSFLTSLKLDGKEYTNYTMSSIQNNIWYTD